MRGGGYFCFDLFWTWLYVLQMCILRSESLTHALPPSLPSLPLQLSRA